MKKLIFTILFIGLFIKAFTQTATQPSVGDGSETSPYQIANLENLYWIAADAANWNDHYIQTADINAGETREWFEGKGWKPIGDYPVAFTGKYNGQMHSIDSLHIHDYLNTTYETYFGLFGKTDGAEITNTVLNAANIQIAGYAYTYTGILAGYSNNSIFSNCTTSGIVNTYSQYGYLYNGGLIGKSDSDSVDNCYSTCIISSSGDSLLPVTGGLIGHIINSSVINSFSAGKLDSESAGGLTGTGIGTITGSFWDVEVSNTSVSTGGTGLTTEEMRDINTYLNSGWDFVGETTNGTDDIWDINDVNNFGYPIFNGQTFPAPPVVTTWGAENRDLGTIAVTGQLTSLGDSDIYQHGICWNLTGDPTVDDNRTEKGAASGIGTFTSVMNYVYSGTDYYIRSYAYNSDGLSYGNEIVYSSQVYPSAAPSSGTGSPDDPYEINSLSNLKWIYDNTPVLGSCFVQTANINAYDTRNWSGGKGWKPIGNEKDQFTGKFDGNGYVIESLYISNSTGTYLGMFGVVSDAELKNVYVIQADITGRGNAGILAGLCLGGTVNNCYTSGSVTGQYYLGGLIGESSSILTECRSNSNVYGSKIGGLVGYNRGIVSKCYSRGIVSGDDIENNMSGGLVGWNISEINNSFSYADINDAGAGGLVGFNDSGSIISNSFSYGSVSGRQSGGLVGFLEYKKDLTNSFWNTETSGVDSSAAGTGLTTSEMKTKQTFLDAGWDFVGETANGTEDIWDMDGVTNNGYPFLTWMATTGMDDDEFLKPAEVNLYQNYPNPFNPVTTIKFTLPKTGKVRITVYNSNGQMLEELVNGKMAAGSHSVLFSAERLNSGIYFYKLDSQNNKIVRKMLLLK